MTNVAVAPSQMRTDSPAKSPIKPRPTVLVATTCRWVSTARLAVALANAGCVVEAVAPPRHLIGKTRAVPKPHSYHGLWPVRSFADAIAATNPDLIVPSDDLATQHLHDIYRAAEPGDPLRDLIERSLGAPESFVITGSRADFMRLAAEEGIRVPQTQVLNTLDDLKQWSIKVGFPLVLKANGTSGGEGVSIVRNMDQAEHAFRRLQAPPLLARAAKWALIDHDMRLVWPSLLRRRSVVNGQSYIPGREATSLVVCWQGKVLAGLHFEVLSKRDSIGPATVMRWIPEPDMAIAAEKMARRLNLSGLHGFDFMLDEGTGHPYLIETNPRATQVGHLALGPGRDLPAALYAAVSGTPCSPAPKITEKDTIALFPQEWLQNPTSAYFQSGYHDVPWGEPELVRTCVRKTWDVSSWFSRSRLAQHFAGQKLPRL